MIDTKELRRLAQAATQHVGRACNYQDAHSPREGHVDFENADLFIASERPEEDAAFYAAANPAAISELLDRLEAAEKNLRCCQAEREEAAALFLSVKTRLAEERDALRAKIAKMERQVPICRAEDLRHAENLLPSLGLMPEDKLYALPGAHAQPAPSVPDKVEVREDKEGEIFSRGSYNEGYDNGWNDCIDVMVAAAPEAKPCP